MDANEHINSGAPARVRDFFNRLEALVALPHIDVNLKDSNGVTPMFYATSPKFHCRPRIAEIFYRSGHPLNLSVKNKDGRTFFENFLLARTSDTWNHYVDIWLKMCLTEEAAWARQHKKYIQIVPC